MVVPILRTKLYTPPIRPELVGRPRLIERLDAGIRTGHRLTLVSAAAGFGKTTLVVEWLSGAGRPFTWLSLDEGDNDPVRFLTYLIAALQGIDEGIGQATRGMLGSPQVPAVALAMTSLINDVAVVPGPFVLVLDDYQDIRVEWVHSAVEFLLTHQPPQLHLVLISRTDPPLPLPRLRVRGQVTEIRADDLRFTTQEAIAFLDQALGETLDGEVVAALEARTEGWIAGLQLASLAVRVPLSMRENAAEAVANFVAAFSGSHRHVIDYLADEVLARQPDEIRRFLCQTAILDRLTAPLCDAVTGRDDSEMLLRQLEQANLFLVPLDDRRQWYRYHALFADFLRTELDQETRAALHVKAARWFTAQDLLPEAVRHALASGNLDHAAQVIALAAEEAFRTAEIATLSGWLDALPEELVQASTELSIYKGFLLLMTDRRSQIRTYADSAERSMPVDTSPHSRGRLLSLKAHLAQCNSAVGSAIQLSREALRYLDRDGFFYDLTLNVLGESLEMQGDIVAAADVYRDAFLSRQKAGNQAGTIIILTDLVFALNELGQRRQALEWCQQVVEDKTERRGQALSLTEGAYLAWSLLSLEANELSLAREQALRSLAFCQQVNIPSGVLWSQYILARVHLANEEIDAMREVCQKARQLAIQANRDALQGAWFAALEAQASLQQGGLSAATRWAETAELAPVDAPRPWDEFVYFTYVRLLLAQGRLDDAQMLLSTMARSAQQGKRNRKLITVRLQQALAEQAVGRAKQALAYVEDALRLAAPQDYRRAFLDEGPRVLDLLSRVRHIAPAFVDSLYSFSQDAHLAQEALLEPLTDREAEILRLIAAGRSNPEIAELLYLSLNTVKWHAKNLYGKLSVGSRVQAIARAQELDLL